jgi:hypothetical protein
MPNMMDLSLKQSQNYALRHLPARALDWHTMRKMVDSLQNFDKYGNAQTVERGWMARDLLLYVLLPSAGYVEVAARNTDLADYLVVEGSASRDDEGKIRVSSHFVRTLVLSRVLTTPQRSVPAETFPFITRYSSAVVGADLPRVDIPRMLATALPFFDVKHIQRAARYSAKTVNGILLPREAVYWEELLQRHVEYTEGLGSNSCRDLIFSYRDNAEVAMELMAGNRPVEVREHYHRVLEYALRTGAPHAWALHFLAIESNLRAAKSWDFPVPPLGVDAIHVIHDESFTNIAMSTWDAAANKWIHKTVVPAASNGDAT